MRMVREKIIIAQSKYEDSFCARKLRIPSGIDVDSNELNKHKFNNERGRA